MKELYRINVIDAGEVFSYHTSNKYLFKFAKSAKSDDDVDVFDIDTDATEEFFVDYIAARSETFEFPFVLLGETSILVD